MPTKVNSRSMGKVAHMGIIEKIMPAVQNRARRSRRSISVTTHINEPASTTAVPRNNPISRGLSMTPVSAGTGSTDPKR